MMDKDNQENGDDADEKMRKLKDNNTLDSTMMKSTHMAT